MKVFVGVIVAWIGVAAYAEPISLRADSWCPHNCDPGDKPGYMIELATNAFKEAKMDIDYQLLNWARAIAESREGKFVGIVGAAKNDAEDFVFPAQPQGMSRSCFYRKAGTKWEYKGVKSLESIAIGVIKDYTYGDEVDAYIKKNEKDNKKIDVVSGDSPLDINLKKLKAGRIGAFIEDEAVGTYNIDTRKLQSEIEPAGCIKATPLFVAFGPKNPKAKEYAKIMGDYMKKARGDGSLAKILAKYGLKDWDKK